MEVSQQFAGTSATTWRAQATAIEAVLPAPLHKHNPNPVPSRGGGQSIRHNDAIDSRTPGPLRHRSDRRTAAELRLTLSAARRAAGGDPLHAANAAATVKGIVTASAVWAAPAPPGWLRPDELAAMSRKDQFVGTGGVVTAGQGHRDHRHPRSPQRN